MLSSIEITPKMLHSSNEREPGLLFFAILRFQLELNLWLLVDHIHPMGLKHSVNFRTLRFPNISVILNLLCKYY